MFYIEHENKIVLADENRQKIVDTLTFLPQYAGAEIKETNREIENLMFVDSPEWIEWKSAQVRELRNRYLREYVDPVVSNTLRWAELSDEQKQEYADYRRYLLDIPEQAEFPKVEIKTFDEWKITQE